MMSIKERKAYRKKNNTKNEYTRERGSEINKMQNEQKREKSIEVDKNKDK